MAANFETRTPGLWNFSGKLLVSLPVLNSGTDAAGKLTVTTITLGASVRVEPLLLVVGDLAPGGSVAVKATFVISSALQVGRSYLLNVRGTYIVGGITYGFALNRVITVPAAMPPPVDFLSAHVEVAVD